MPLLGNRSVFHKSPARSLNGGHAILRSNFNKHGMMRNAFEQFSAVSAIPYGHLSPSAWVLPKRAGGMSSRNVTTLDVSLSGTAYGGITTTASASFIIDFGNAQAFPLNDSAPARTASASFSINFSNASGQLISSGTGSASMQFTFANALLTASIGGIGSADFTISTNTPLLGARASAIGSAAMQITIANAQAYPLNDASPARTASGGLSFAGSLTPYAIGSMQGDTVDNSVLTSDTIAAAVWNAVASEFNEAGSTGNKLNTASSGGVDIQALVDAVLDDPRFKKVLTKGTFLALK